MGDKEAGDKRDLESITDDTGRFHHIENAYVVGPALYPTIGSANPSLAGLSLARRTAEAIVAPIRGRRVMAQNNVALRSSTVKELSGSNFEGQVTILMQAGLPEGKADALRELSDRLKYLERLNP